MKWKARLILFGALLLLCSWWLYRCGRVNRRPVYETKIEKGSGFKAEIDKKRGVLTIVQTSSGRRVSRRSSGKRQPHGNSGESVPITRRATVAFDGKTGHLIVTAPKGGFVFEPGFSCVYGDTGLRLGIDVQWGFYGRWGGVAGLSGKTSSVVSPRLYLGVLFQPFKERLTNTSLLVGIDNRKDIQVGIRVSF